MSENRNVIAAIGLCTLDHMMMVDAFTAREGTYKCESYHTDGGGMAATALCAAARLGSAVRLISRIGDDVNGAMILQGLREFGVDTGYIAIMPGHHSIVCITLVESGRGQKQFFTENHWPLYGAGPEFDPAALEDARLLLVDGHGGAVTVAGVRWAQSHGIPVVADLKRRYETFEAIIPLVDYLIIPEFFARELVPATSDERMLCGLHALCRGVVVVTQGARGGMYYHDGRIDRYPAFPVDVVDTTGAGDAFHGAFCHYLVQGKTLHESLVHASAAGALNCRALGGRAALPDSGEVNRMAGSMP